MAFILLDCPKTVASVDSVYYPIALLNEVENYERLQLALCDIAAEVKDLHGATVMFVCMMMTIFMPSLIE